MKHPFPLLTALFLTQCAPVPAQAWMVDGNTIILTDAEAANCNAKGGCLIIPLETLKNAVEAAKKVDVSCRREST